MPNLNSKDKETEQKLKEIADEIAKKWLAIAGITLFQDYVNGIIKQKGWDRE